MITPGKLVRRVGRKNWISKNLKNELLHFFPPIVIFTIRLLEEGGW
jgi:hypothetical protein